MRNRCLIAVRAVADRPGATAACATVAARWVPPSGSTGAAGRWSEGTETGDAQAGRPANVAWPDVLAARVPAW